MGGDSEAFQRYLEDQDPCYGKHYAKSAPECQVCLLPVLTEDHHLLLLNEACAAEGKGADPGTLARIPAQEIREALQRGETPLQLWLRILNGCDPLVAGQSARQLLMDRLYYLETTQGIPRPQVPTTKELQRDSDQ